MESHRVKKMAQLLLAGIGRPDASLSVLLVDDQRMKQIHERWMGDARPVDVLSFPMEEPAEQFTVYSLQFTKNRAPHTVNRTPPKVLGDIVISVETLARRSGERLFLDLRRCLIHGLLHLVGFDHTRQRDSERMEREARSLERLIE